MGNRAYCWGSWCYWACPCDSIFIVRIKGSAMCFRMDVALKQARVKELDARESQKQDEREESECMDAMIHGTHPAVGFFIPVFSLVSAGVSERERGICGGERTCVAIAGRVGGRLCYGSYVLLSLPLVSQSVSQG